MQRCMRMTAMTTLLAVAFLYPLLAPTVHRIDPQHWKMIRPGMTADEVEGIFGVPSGCYARSSVLANPRDRIIGMETPNGVTHVYLPPEPNRRYWGSAHGVYFILLDEQGRVTQNYSWTGGRPITMTSWNRWWRKWTGS